MTTSTERIDAFANIVNRVGCAACVGLDPVLEKLPAGLSSDPAKAIEEFSTGIIDSIRGTIGVIKPQSACFERYGSAGFRALERTVAHAKAAGLWVVLDAKRGDIGISAEHYAAAAANMGADAITVNLYLGPSTLEPYLSAGLAIFVLVRTSNPDSDLIQSVGCADRRSVAQMVASLVASLGERHRGSSGVSAVGAVVGATKAADAQSLRAAMPDQVFLIPGYGAQGGALSDVRGMTRPNSASQGTSGVLVTASRSVIYPGGDTGSWQDRVRIAAQGLAGEIATLSN
ncbi:MAG: orotidine-5'-phosphate decarboxylase [Planctomycetes bacterium]|nr:orotidine-5'-phosphate decarboxylase [Planctomycetota bacterium]